MNQIEMYEEGWFFHNHAWFTLHEIIKQIPRGALSLLDVGAGTGIAAAIIQAVYPDITCYVTDIEQECFEFWKKRKIIGLCSDIQAYNKEFDVVISSHVIEHLENPRELIKNMFNAAIKRIIIVVPDGDCHFYDHKVIYNRTIFKNTIEEALEGEKYNLITYPHYHPHINNLFAVVDK